VSAEIPEEVGCLDASGQDDHLGRNEVLFLIADEHL
jgi:hypothetical protein